MAATTSPSSYAPDPIQDFGDIPQVSAYQDTAALVDPNQSAGYMNTAYSQNAAALAPTFQQENSQLADANAARGITNSGAGAQLQSNLLGQQAGTLASADEPITAQGYSYNQADLLANQANTQSSGLANQAADMSASGTNASLGADALNYNANAYNSYLSNLEGQQYNTGNELLSSYLGTYEPNSAVTSLISGGEGAGEQGYNSAYSGAISNEDSILGSAGGGLSGAFGNSNYSGNYSGNVMESPVENTEFTDAPYIL